MNVMNVNNRTNWGKKKNSKDSEIEELKVWNDNKLKNNWRMNPIVIKSSSFNPCHVKSAIISQG